MSAALNVPHDASPERITKLPEELRGACAPGEALCSNASAAPVHLRDVTAEQARQAIVSDWGFCNMDEAHLYFALNPQARSAVVAGCSVDLTTLQTLF